MKFILTALIAAMGAASFGTIINASFEEPVYTTGAYGSSGMPGWSSIGTYGAWNIPSGSFFEAEAPHGTQIGYTNGPAIAQQTDDVLEVGTTTLSVMGGRRSDFYSSSFFLQLWAGGTQAAGNVTGGTMLGEVLFDVNSVAKGSFKMVTLDYQATADDPNLGKQLTIRMFQQANSGGGQINFDDVRLNAVPEPGTWLALGVGACALIRRRRRG